MLTRFLKAAKGSTVWLVIPHAVVCGELATYRIYQEQIDLIKLRDVTITQGGAETSVDELMVPSMNVSAWGTDDDSFDHLSPDINR
jgi:hypothetical protein